MREKVMSPRMQALHNKVVNGTNNNNGNTNGNNMSGYSAGNGNNNGNNRYSASSRPSLDPIKVSNV